VRNAFTFAYNSTLFVIYESLCSNAMLSIHDTKPNIDDAALTLIFHWRIHYLEPLTLDYYINTGLVAAVLCSSCTLSFIATLLFNDA
jgi:hypothetical protein